MMIFKKIREFLLNASLCLTLGSSLYSCNSSNGNDDTLIAFFLLQSLSGSNYTLDSTTGCISGITSTMDDALPAWIQDNFKCSVGSVDGTNYVFTSKNLPNTKSFYYGTGKPLYEDLPDGNSADGSNLITAQNFTYTIPTTPTVNGGSKTSTNGLAAIGVTVNGIAIFNNKADSGDDLSTESNTFDNFNGHPSTSGVYNYHLVPTNISDDDAALVGVALDGYPIYGVRCDQATTSTADDNTPGIGTPALDAYHGHTANTVLFPGGIYHYHFGYDGTAGMQTLMGSFFNGNVGSVSNN